MNQSEPQWPRSRALRAYRSFRHKIHDTAQSILERAAEIISLVSIGLGSVLLASSLLMLVLDTGFFMSSTHVSMVSNNFLNTVAQLPGIPFDLTELKTSPSTISGILVWILGLDIVLVGLGIWVKNRLARYAGITVFGLAAYFNFVKFLLFGILGSPSSIIELAVNSTILYLLFKSEIWTNVKVFP